MTTETEKTNSNRIQKQGDYHLSLARASIRQSLARYSNLRHFSPTRNPELISTLQTQLDILSSNLDKLEHNVIRIAVFGLVSRGKSAVLNALLGQKVLQTGPTHGVTQWPRSVRWTIPPSPGKEDKIGAQIELIDTPGLDEVGGEVRGEIAKEVTSQADLILFVVSGDITRTEYDALTELRKTQKPLILVFNKIDLYPEIDRQTIYDKLQTLAQGELTKDNWELEPPPPVKDMPLPSDEIVMVAAEPAPLQVRVELPNGKINYEWETPQPKIDELKQTLLRILNREGRSLIALNSLLQARNAELILAQTMVKLCQKDAEQLIENFMKYKAIVIAVNPIAILDVLGGSFADLILIRSLGKLYGFPMTGKDAGELWKSILFSAGGLIVGEFTSNLMLGLGKMESVASSDLNWGNYAGGAIAQAGVAAYGTYVVGKAAQKYLEKGCTWGELGQDRVIQNILNQVDKNTILYRVKQEFINT